MKDETQTTREEMRQMCLEAMQDEAVTNISGWTEPSSDDHYDEKEYRERLAVNAPDYIAKVKRVLTFG